MGRVYLGRSPDGVIVAVKVVKREYADDPHFLERFRREMQAAEFLGNGYTASLVGCDPSAAPPWLATKFIVGASLAAIMDPAGDGTRVAPLDIGAVWWLAFGLIKALTEIDACRIVHRDLKPANVIIAPDGPKVIDFGIALGLRQSVLEAHRLTAVGGRVGTPVFMSPEQFQGLRELGAASDIFALGTVLAYSATGMVPERDTVGRVVWDGPGLRSLPPELGPLIQRCLRTRPEDRAKLDELLSIVITAKRDRYQPAVPSFWPQPMAGRVAAASDAIRLSLPSDVVRYLPQQQAEEAIPPEPEPRDRPQKRDDFGRSQPPRTLPLPPLPRPMDNVLFHAYQPDIGLGSLIRRPGDPLDAVAYLLDAETLWKSRYFVEAEDAYRASLKLDETNASAHVDLGCLLWDRRRYRDAMTAFRDALEHAPELIAARRNLFIATKNAGGDDKLSELRRGELTRYCKAVLATEARDAADYANHGDALCCLERYADAVPLYQQALSYDEGNDRLHRKLEYATRRLGER